MHGSDRDSPSDRVIHDLRVPRRLFAELDWQPAPVGHDAAGPGERAATGTEVPPRLVTTTGLPARTTRRTVPDMFRRHRTDPEREIASLVSAFHDRLAGSLVTTRTDPPRVDPRNLRDRLGTPAVGLRDRMDRRPHPA